MKKIFLICRNPIENLDVFISSETKDISILLLHQKQDVVNIPVFQVWKLGEVDPNGSNLSYQNFLEQIFLHDVASVI